MKPLVRPFTDPADGQWFIVSARYPTDELGSIAYRYVMAKVGTSGDLGVYRHGAPDEGGVLVTAISTNRIGVQNVARLLGARGGIDEHLDKRIVTRMAIRRARVVVEARDAGAKPGRLKIGHAGRGAWLNPDGSMSDDRPQGQG